MLYTATAIYGNNKYGKSPAPKDEQRALDQSVSLGATTTARLGVSCGEIVVLRLTCAGVYHGHAISWDNIRNNSDFQDAIGTLIKQEMLNSKGLVLK